MKFGLFYQQQLPKPWLEGTEAKNFSDHLTQCALADELGFDSVWVTEHHFLEEYSHSSAPEVFLGAVAARTSRIRLGHGIRHTPPLINPPARIAEALGTLDIISNGRVEFGFGEGATRLELAAHGINAKEKRAMSLEAAEQIANMMAMTPYPGWRSNYFEMACRNVVPKPLQKPHPPMWMACTNRETIKEAARRGVGALAFTYVDPRDAGEWAKTYYDIIKSEECVPLGHTVNARIAMVSGLSIADDRAEGVRQGFHCANFFRFALESTILRDSVPGHSNLWDDYMKEVGRPDQVEAAAAEAVAAGDAYLGPSGTPEDVARRLRVLADAGIDDVLFTIQGGWRSHENICENLSRFAKEIMPAFQAAQAQKQAQRDAELAPYIANAIARKKFMPALRRDQIPVVLGASRNVTSNFAQLKIG